MRIPLVQLRAGHCPDCSSSGTTSSYARPPVAFVVTPRQRYLRGLLALSSLVVVVAAVAGLASLAAGNWVRGVGLVLFAILLRGAIAVVSRRAES